VTEVWIFGFHTDFHHCPYNSLHDVVCCSYPEEDNIAQLLGLPADDVLLLQRENVWYQALPVILYLVAYAFMFLYGYVMQAYVAVVARMLSPIVTRLLLAACY